MTHRFDVRAKLIDVVLSIGADQGTDALTVRKIADAAGISSGLVYSFFSSKNDLLNEAYLSVDREISAVFDSLEAPKDFKVTCHDDYRKAAFFLWSPYYDYLVSNPVKTRFYQKFRSAAFVGSDITPGNRPYSDSFINSIARFMNNADPNILMTHKMDLFWMFIIDCTLTQVVNVLRYPHLRKDPTCKEQIFILVWGGVGGALPTMMESVGHHMLFDFNE